MSAYVGRFAPSPTGPLHQGSLVAALASWLRARQAGGHWLLRIEDIDPPREQPGAAQVQIEMLAALGLVPDAEPLYQSQRAVAYRAALDDLLARGLAFGCSCSRSDLAPSGGIHRGPCRPSDPSRPPAYRLRVDDRRIAFDDRVFGRVEQDLAADVGDFVLRRADGLWAYQLAVVVDDAAQGITEVVRGADLLDSTPRQIALQRALGLPTPRYLHVPLVLDAGGNKLSKSEGAGALDVSDPVSALRAACRHLGIANAALDVAFDRAGLLDLAVHAFDPGRLQAPSPRGESPPPGA